MLNPPKERPPLREVLAELAHKTWADWMLYQFQKGGYCGLDTEGKREVIWIMPAWAVERWRRQMQTPYEKLSEEEKESDRKEADKILLAYKDYDLDWQDGYEAGLKVGQAQAEILIAKEKRRLANLSFPPSLLYELDWLIEVASHVKDGPASREIREWIKKVKTKEEEPTMEKPQEEKKGEDTFPIYDHAATLLRMIQIADAVDSLSNERLSTILVEELASELDIDSPAYALLMEVALRLSPDLLLEEPKEPKYRQVVVPISLDTLEEIDFLVGSASSSGAGTTEEFDTWLEKVRETVASSLKEEASDEG